eukprot:61115-Rhodomonas_salina.1
MGLHQLLRASEPVLTVRYSATSSGTKSRIWCYQRRTSVPHPPPLTSRQPRLCASRPPWVLGLGSGV